MKLDLEIEREKLIHQYITAWDEGNLDVIGKILNAACLDRELARIIEEIDKAFIEEEGIILSREPNPKFIKKRINDYLDKIRACHQLEKRSLEKMIKSPKKVKDD